jgi:23S rRNA (uracil1939-C5)-methyltransferase
MNLKPGREIDVVIENVAFGGKGVARIDGLVCFIPFTLPNEKVKVRITSVKKSYMDAEIIEILEPSPDRVTPRCEYFGTCGGCQYQHSNYENQLSMKVSQLTDVLRRVGHLENLPELEAVIPSKNEFAYRNRITMAPFKSSSDFISFGFKALDNRTTLEIRNCPIARDEVNNLIPMLKRTTWGRKNIQREKPRTATLRYSGSDEPIIFYGSAPEGIPWRKELIHNQEFRVPLNGFYQVNPEVAMILLNITTDWLSSLAPSRVVDAFCGAGFLSIGLKDKHIVGIEENETSINAARYNASLWGIKSYEYIAGDANKLVDNQLKGRGSKTILIVDPPRKGCGEQTLKSIKNHKPAWILYVSCDPATLARDLKEISEEYTIDKMALLDMFPQTSHFETMVLLKSKDLKDV